MKRQDFLKEISEAIQAGELKETDSLLDLDVWDSLAETATLLVFNTKLGLFINIQKIRDCNTVEELLDLGAEKYE